MLKSIFRDAGRRAAAGVLLLAAAATTAPVNAQSRANPSLAGTWTLVAADVESPDGTRVQAYGEHPQGRMIIDQKGRYSIQIFRGDRAPIVWSTGTLDEYKAAMFSMSTNFGEITPDWSTHVLRTTLVMSSDPNSSGQVQMRPFTLEGDVLSYRLPPRPDGSRAMSVWRRDP